MTRACCSARSASTNGRFAGFEYTSERLLHAFTFIADPTIRRKRVTNHVAGASLTAGGLGPIGAPLIAARCAFIRAAEKVCGFHAATLVKARGIDLSGSLAAVHTWPSRI